MRTVTLQADAILFDNDGVLVDSHPEVEQAWRQLCSEFDLDADSLLPELIGVRAVDTLSRYLPPDVVARATDRLEDLEVELAPRTQPMAGAIDLLATLPGLPWTIVTSATRRLAEARWRGAGIAIPARPVTAEDVTRGKPDPEPFLVGAATLGVDPGRCVVFEDSPSGGAAGLAAGATTVAVGDHRWAHSPAARVGDLSMVEVEVGVGAGVEPGQPLTVTISMA